MFCIVTSLLLYKPEVTLSTDFLLAVYDNAPGLRDFELLHPLLDVFSIMMMMIIIITCHCHIIQIARIVTAATAEM